jgi:hypothetical protein
MHAKGEGMKRLVFDSGAQEHRFILKVVLSVQFESKNKT